MGCTCTFPNSCPQCATAIKYTILEEDVVLWPQDAFNAGRLAALREVREMVRGRMYDHAARGDWAKKYETEAIGFLIDAMIAKEER